MNLTYVNLTSIKNNPLKLVGMLFNHCSSLTLDNIVGLDNLNLSNVTNMGSMFEYCSNITQLPFTTIPDSVTNINNIFKNTGITDISGLTIGSGVTSATDWIKDCPITTANNITMKNDAIKFSGCSNLVSCTNFKITSNVTQLSQVFKDCPKLTSFSFSSESDFSNVTRLDFTFDGASSLVSLNLSNVVCTSKLTTIDGLCRGCGGLTTLYLPSNLQDSSIKIIYQLATDAEKLKTIYNLYLPDGFEEFGNYSLGWVGAIEPKHAMDIIGFRVPNTTNPATVFAKVYKMFKSFSNVIWPETTTSIAGMFQNLIHLTHDLEIPSYITDCSNAFKGCTGMTHVHSNWKNSYDNGITSTDCYAGCTGITHIDDEYVLAYDGDSGIDYVPKEWGGYGFEEDFTSVVEIVTTKANQSFEMGYFNNFVYKNNDVYANTKNAISWGDGTYYGSSDILNASNYDSSNGGIHGGQSVPAHTYATPGTYYVKGNFKFGDGIIKPGTFTSAVTRVLKVARKVEFYITRNGNKRVSAITNFGLGFAYLSNCTYINVSNLATNSCTNLESMFRNCSSLTTLDLSDWDVGYVTNFQDMFSNCTSLTTLNLSGWNIGENVSLELGNRKAIGMAKMFEKATKLSTLNVSNWTFSDTCYISCDYMFSGVNNLSSLDFSTWRNCYIRNCAGMFKDMTKLQNILGVNNFNLSLCTNLYCLFQNCTSLTTLDLSGLGTSNITDMYGIFFNCTNLQTITGLETWDVSKVKTFSSMFRECRSLTEINLPTTNFKGKSITMALFALNTTSLTTLDLTPWTNVTVTEVNSFLDNSSVTSFDVSTIDASVPNISYFLKNSTTLQEFKFFKSLKFTDLAKTNPFTNFSLSGCTNLSKASIVNFLKVLPDISSSRKSYAIPLGATNKAKLTSSEIAIATNKGYTIV